MRREVVLKIEATFSEVILIGCLMTALVAIAMARRDCRGRRNEKEKKWKGEGDMRIENRG